LQEKNAKKKSKKMRKKTCAGPFLCYGSSMKKQMHYGWASQIIARGADCAAAFAAQQANATTGTRFEIAKAIFEEYIVVIPKGNITVVRWFRK
jgi:hypothetical protein